MAKKYGDLNLITVFLEVYRLRSITLAAESLDLTQPAISNALKRFKAQMNDELFIREGRGITPTSTADHLAVELEPMIKHINNTIGNLHEFDVNSSRTFRILLPEPLLYSLHHYLENDERLGNCEIDYDLLPSSRNELLKLLSLQKVDLAIDVARVDNPSYSSEHLYSEDLSLICSQDHPRIGDNISLPDYLNEKHVALDLKRNGLHTIDYYTSENLQMRKVKMESSSPLAMIAMVGGGELVGVTSETLFRQYGKILNVKRVASPFYIRPIEYHLVHHKKVSNSPGQIWLLNYIKEILSEIANKNVCMM
jgi:DNA-binding transcriptional LysR family regulator